MTITDSLHAQVAEARVQVEHARNRYDAAQGHWVDVRAAELTAAECRLSVLLCEARGQAWTPRQPAPWDRGGGDVA